MTRIAGILFDKDGTLFDFNATWAVWAYGVIERLSDGDAERAALMADAIGFLPAQMRFAAGSPVIAGTPAEVAGYLLTHLPGRALDELVTELDAAAQTAPQVAAVPLAPCLGGLQAQGLRLGVCTNDSEAAARAHLETAGVVQLFDMIVGYDSGYGEKPAPGPLLAFARKVGLEPAMIAMVGDSPHDLHAARAAGMVAVGVLSGPADEATLAPLADVVLPDISALAAWAALRG